MSDLFQKRGFYGVKIIQPLFKKFSIVLEHFYPNLQFFGLTEFFLNFKSL